MDRVQKAVNKAAKRSKPGKGYYRSGRNGYGDSESAAKDCMKTDSDIFGDDMMSDYFMEFGPSQVRHEVGDDQKDYDGGVGFNFYG